MKWFTEVFLPSFDGRFDSKNQIWLSEKQAMVCRKYMSQSKYFPMLYIVVGDYQYSLTFTKKGYARLTREDKTVAYH